jgi:hypothetical protein
MGIMIVFEIETLNVDGSMTYDAGKFLRFRSSIQAPPGTKGAGYDQSQIMDSSTK